MAFDMPLKSTSLSGHPSCHDPKLITGHQNEFAVHCSVHGESLYPRGSHCTPGGVTPPLGINDRGVIHPGESLIPLTAARRIAACLCGHPKCNLLLAQARPRMIQHLSSLLYELMRPVSYVSWGVAGWVIIESIINL